MSLFVHSLLIPWHHLQENNSQTLWFVQDIQMLWYDWCKLKIGKSDFFFSIKKKKKLSNYFSWPEPFPILDSLWQW